MNIYIDCQLGRWIDRKIDKQKDRQIDTYKNRCCGGQLPIVVTGYGVPVVDRDRQIDEYIYRLLARQMDRQKDR